jgi:hypothetical protein
MAPEQIQANPIDHRADIYAVGSTLFELIAGIGRTPFRADTFQKQLMDVLMEPAPRLSDRAKLPESVREELDRLVARCLEKQPSDRPASAREIADQLGEIAAKLEGRTSAAAQSEVPTLMLRGDDAAVVSLPEVVETRKRARRELRARRAWSSRSATVLSAAAAAAAMWVATTETSWAHALSRVTAWRSAAAMASASTPEHVVTPIVYDDTLSTAHVAEPVGGVGAPAPLLTAAVPKASHIDIALGDEPNAVEQEGAAEPATELEAIDDARRARKAARAKARAERQAHFDQAELVITPAASHRESDDAPAEEPSYDRDLVLNPFGQ